MSVIVVNKIPPIIVHNLPVDATFLQLRERHQFFHKTMSMDNALLSKTPI